MMRTYRTSPLKIKELEFQINLDNVGRDGRTTIMLRNIPNKYTQEMILHEIDESGLYRRYDFFYLPIDYKVHLFLYRTTVMLAMRSLIFFIQSLFTYCMRSSMGKNGGNLTHKRYVKFVMRGFKELPS